MGAPEKDGNRGPSGMLVEEDGWLRLSETGIDVSNRIMAEFV